VLFCNRRYGNRLRVAPDPLRAFHRIPLSPIYPITCIFARKLCRNCVIMRTFFQDAHLALGARERLTERIEALTGVYALDKRSL
jgi:hypothetical protein